MDNNRRSIQILRGAEGFDPSISDEVLLDGQPFYSKKNKQLYIGDGNSKLKDLNATQQYFKIGEHSNFSPIKILKSTYEPTTSGLGEGYSWWGAPSDSSLPNKCDCEAGKTYLVQYKLTIDNTLSTQMETQRYISLIWGQDYALNTAYNNQRKIITQIPIVNGKDTSTGNSKGAIQIVEGYGVVKAKNNYINIMGRYEPSNIGNIDKGNFDANTKIKIEYTLYPLDELFQIS